VSYLQGVSIRRVQDIVSRLGIEELSASSVSRIGRELDEKVEEFLKTYPISYFLSLCRCELFQSKDQFKICYKGVFNRCRDQGWRLSRDISARIADGEDELFWSGLFQDLKDRGLSGVQLVISYGYKGIQKAVEKSFASALWQISLTEVSESFDEVETCVMSISCELFWETLPRKYQKESAGKLKVSLEDENKMQELIQELESRPFQSRWYHRTFQIRLMEP
jgi:putative transposase